MLTAQRTVVSGRVASRCAPALPARPARASVVRRYRNEPEDTIAEDMKGVAARQDKNSETGSKLSAEQLEELVRTPAGVFSPRRAEMRADLGKAAEDPAMAKYAGPLQTLQAFDGPIPETLNGRLCMLAVPIALWDQFTTGQTILESAGANPARVAGIFIAITIATCVPVIRGYTRKEPYANSIWTPMAENWNGRLAMLGFTGMLLGEMITGVNTLQAWGLQDVYFGIRSATGL